MKAAWWQWDEGAMVVTAGLPAMKVERHVSLTNSNATHSKYICNKFSLKNYKILIIPLSAKITKSLQTEETDTVLTLLPSQAYTFTIPHTSQIEGKKVLTIAQDDGCYCTKVITFRN